MRSSRIHDKRGNSRDRARRKQYLLDQFGDGTHAHCYRCGKLLSYDTITVGRTTPGSTVGRIVERIFDLPAGSVTALLVLLLAGEGESVEKTGLVNCYVCDLCDQEAWTVNRATGVTPMRFRCVVTDKCRGWMVSSFYDVSQDHAVAWEWYKPDLNKRMSRTARAHALRGGLELRRIETEESKSD